MTLYDMIGGYLLARRSELAATTLANYGVTFDKLIDYFGEDKSVKEIDESAIKAFLSHLRDRGLKDRSIVAHYIVCSSLWSFAEKELGFPHVVRQVPKPKFQKPLIESFSDQDIKELVDAAQWTSSWNTRKGRWTRSKRPTAKRDVAIILLLLDTGIRASELCALEYRDYNHENGRLHIRLGKGNKQRIVYMGTRAQRALWRYLVERTVERPDDPLIATKTGNALDRNNLRHTLNRISDNAGVENVHPHRFRHTFAIQFLRNGGNIFELQRILGHDSLETVQIYLSLSNVDLERAQRAHSPADNWRL